MKPGLKSEPQGPHLVVVLALGDVDEWAILSERPGRAKDKELPAVENRTRKFLAERLLRAPAQRAELRHRPRKAVRACRARPATAAEDIFLSALGRIHNWRPRCYPD